jgi:GDP-L-fucose synthase
MNIFVTGGNGFLGRFLIESLRQDGHNVVCPTSKECDLTDDKSLNQFNDINFEKIYHLAAWTQAGDFCLRHSGEQWIINQKINTNLLTWWQKTQSSSKLIFMGTSCAYDPDLELVEENYMAGEPIESLYTYAMTKRMLLQGARALEKQFGMEWLCVVPSTLYGSGYHTDGRQMHFIFDLIRKIILGQHQNKEVVLWGDGTQRRELVLVSDFINTLHFLEKNNATGIYNIGSGKDYTITFFAEQISALIGYDKGLIKYDTTKYVGAKSKKLIVNKLLNINPEYIHQQTSLKIGLENVIKWFENTYFK